MPDGSKVPHWSGSRYIDSEKESVSIAPATGQQIGLEFKESGWKASDAGRLHGLCGIDDFLEYKQRPATERSR